MGANHPHFLWGGKLSPNGDLALGLEVMPSRLSMLLISFHKISFLKIKIKKFGVNFKMAIWYSVEIKIK